MTTGLTPASAGPAPPVTTTITTVGQTAYVVPAGVTEIAVTVVGAGGGVGNGGEPSGPDGRGATVLATIPVTPGATLYAEVGSSSGAGGGGASGYAANGGGESALQSLRCGCTYTALPSTDPRLVAAGGGGGGGEGGSGSTGGKGGDAAGVTGPGSGGNGTNSHLQRMPAVTAV